MERTLVALLAALLVLTALPALAETQELTFQGIAWGAACEEAMTVLVQEKKILSRFYGMEPFDRSSQYSDYTIKFLWPEDETQIGEEILSSYQGAVPYLDVVAVNGSCGMPVEQTIGGYAPESIGLTFLRAAEGNYGLSSVVICFDPLTNDAAALQLDDLAQKLTSVYGEPELVAGKDGDMRVWHGANDTGIALLNLVESIGGTDQTFTYLIYAKTSDHSAAASGAAAAPTEAPQSEPEDAGL